LHSEEALQRVGAFPWLAFLCDEQSRKQRIDRRSTVLDAWSRSATDDICAAEPGLVQLERIAELAPRLVPNSAHGEHLRHGRPKHAAQGRTAETVERVHGPGTQAELIDRAVQRRLRDQLTVKDLRIFLAFRR